MDTQKPDDKGKRPGVVKAYKEHYINSHKIDRVTKAKPPNLNCSIHKFGCLLSKIVTSDLKLKWVREMGFGNLLYLAGKTLPRDISYWLLSRFDPDTMSILGSDDVITSINAVHVHWVLGITNEGKEIVLKSLKPTKEVGEFIERYSSTRGANPGGVYRRELEIAIEDTTSEVDFKQTFLMYALCTVLAPTTSDRVRANLLPLVSLACTAREYNWAEFVLAELTNTVERFHKKHEKDGVVKGSGGCIYVLLIYYLDRLRKRPLKWETFPRIKVWSNEEVHKRIRETQHENLFEYDKLTMLNVHYGKRHLLEAEDLMPIDKDMWGPKLSELKDMKLLKGLTRKSTGRPYENLKKAKRRRVFHMRQSF